MSEDKIMLIDLLIDRRDEKRKEAQFLEAKLIVAQRYVYDYDKAIAALAPRPPPVKEGDGPEIERVHTLEDFLKLRGATLHDGSACPLTSGNHIEIYTRGCGGWPVKITEDAPLSWDWGGSDPHPTDILAYRIISTNTPPTRTAESGEQSEGVRQFTREVIASETRDPGEQSAPEDETTKDFWRDRYPPTVEPI